MSEVMKGERCVCVCVRVCVLLSETTYNIFRTLDFVLSHLFCMLFLPPHPSPPSPHCLLCLHFPLPPRSFIRVHNDIEIMGWKCELVMVWTRNSLQFLS